MIVTIFDPMGVGVLCEGDVLGVGEFFDVSVCEDFFELCGGHEGAFESGLKDYVFGVLTYLIDEGIIFVHLWWCCGEDDLFFGAPKFGIDGDI